MQKSLPKTAPKYSSPITKTHPFKYIENFTTKNENFQMKNSGSFHISAQNIEAVLTSTQSTFLSKNKKRNAYP